MSCCADDEVGGRGITNGTGVDCNSATFGSGFHIFNGLRPT